MNMIPVHNSSNVVAIGYDGTNVRVQFKSGIYLYHNVPINVWDNFQNSSSKGEFVHHTLKRYPATKIG